MAAAGKVKTYDLGPAVDADMLWFNLRADRKKPAAARPWTDVRFRRAVLQADRPPGLRRHRLSRRRHAARRADHAGEQGVARQRPAAIPYDAAKAKALFAEVGVADTNGDGVLDLKGKPFDDRAPDAARQRRARARRRRSSPTS